MAGWAVQVTVGSAKFWINGAGLEKVTRSTNYRWPAQERIGRSIALQYVGPGEDSIELAGYIHPMFKGRVGNIEEIRKLAAEGKPQMVTLGTGEVLGKWCIVDVKEDKSGLLDDLRPRRIDFTVTLKKYGDDGEKK